MDFALNLSMYHYQWILLWISVCITINGFCFESQYVSLSVDFALNLSMYHYQWILLWISVCITINGFCFESQYVSLSMDFALNLFFESMYHMAQLVGCLAQLPEYRLWHCSFFLVARLLAIKLLAQTCPNKNTYICLKLKSCRNMV